MKLHDRIFLICLFGISCGCGLLFSVCLYITLAEGAPFWVPTVFAVALACCGGMNN